jgi:nicotinate-nucleotide--dimethylbenzimidazole phosphoribosyltransferase
LVAKRVSPAAADVLFFSHLSRERGQRHILRAFNQEPFFDLGFALGEGTGAVFGMQFISLGSRVLAEVDCF